MAVNEKSAGRTALRWLLAITWVAFIGLGLVNMIRDSDSNSDLWRSATLIMGGLSVFFLILLVVGALARKRRETLAAAHPGSIVFSIGREAALVSGLSALRGQKLKMTDVPELMAVVVDSRELRLVSGHHKHLRTEFLIPLADVIGVQQGKVQGGFTSFNGVEFLIRSPKGDTVELPFAVTGRGWGGLYAVSAREAWLLADRIRGMLPDPSTTAATTQEHSDVE